MSADEQIRLLREILKWIRFAGAKEVGDVLVRALDSKQKRLVYHLSDGERGAVQIGEAANISDRTVRRYWESWARLGIVDSMKVRGGERYMKSFELEDFGIEVPDLAEVSAEGEKPFHVATDRSVALDETIVKQSQQDTSEEGAASEQ